ncbi:MAG: amino acid adenylation domain-containing protein, partial [Nannocystaceae bacterium]
EAVEEAGGLRTGIEYNSDLFDASTIARMSGHLRQIFGQMTRSAQQRVAAIDILGATERQRLLVDWNRTEATFSDGACIHELFEQWVDRTPDAVAIVDHCAADSKVLVTYAQLEQRSNQLAHHLRDQGVGPDVIVGLYTDRGAAQIVAILGILKAGGAFVPLDPDHPDRRLEMMLADTELGFVVSQHGVRPLPQSAAITVIDIESDPVAAPSTRPIRCTQANNLAYIIYTSGSTGDPNGVLVEHRSLVNSIESDIRMFETGPGSRFPHLTSFNFDAALSHLLVLLCAGGTIHLIARDADSLGPNLLDTMEREAITHAIMPVAMLAALPLAELPQLRMLAAGAEAVSPEVVTRWGQNRRFFNVYGPTEVTITATVMRCVADGRPPPIGRPIANLQAYVVDSSGRLAPPGVPGELYLGGIGVARGYLKRPELTARVFIDNPFGEGRVYRTGDRVRWRIGNDDTLPTLEFLGRLDNQVKIRGYRIELAEVEHALKKSSRVQDAVVTIFEGTSGKRLVAYVTPRLGERSNIQERERITYWEAMHGDALERDDDNASTHANNDDPTLDLRGWTSSYSGDALPIPEMRAWVDATVASILATKPQSVLEVGCGTGMLLTRVAPKVTRYHGTDLSGPAVDHIEKLRTRLPGLQGVSTSKGPAHEVLARVGGGYDTVVLNSVAQYFPSSNYLREVLTAAVNAIDSTGAIFVGDIRNFALMQVYHVAVEAARAGPGMGDDELRGRVRQAIDDENELLVHPHFFTELAASHPRISRVSIRPKHGDYHNELSQFRYDVVLHIGSQPSANPTTSWHDWEAENWSLARLQEALKDVHGHANGLGVHAIPNARLSKEVAREKQLYGHQNAPSSSEAFRPDDLVKLAASRGLAAEVSWSNGRSDGAFDVYFYSPTHGPATAVPQHGDAPQHVANDPLAGVTRRQLVNDLTSELADALPSHLVPSSFMVLKAFPLTINGKVNVKALPPPRVERDARSAADNPPTTKKEQALAAIWCRLLGLTHVGVRDNFFALGGDSIVGMQVVAQARESGIVLRASQVFEHQTLAELASAAVVEQSAPVVEQTTVVGAVPLSPIQRWFFAGDRPDPHHFNQALIVETAPDLDADRLRQALEALVRHHDA